MSELDIRIQHTINRMVTFRNLKQINMEEFRSALNFGNIENIEDLDLVNEKYETELTRFEEDIANMKRVLRRCKKIWMRNGTEDSWRAYQKPEVFTKAR